MREALISLPLSILPVHALAQQKPKVEVFGGHSYLMADMNGSSFHLYGVDFPGAENVNSWFGGALDFSSRAALRLFRADYLLTRFGARRQGNIRLSAGIVLRFGKK